MDNPQQDVLIIGAGCVGAFAAFYLCKYDLKVTIIDAVSPAAGATKANSGIVHSSHNIEKGTIKHSMVDEGNKRIGELA